MQCASTILVLLGARALLAQFSEVPLSVNPPMVAVDSGEVDLIVTGAGFQSGWQVLWNGLPRPTEFLDSYRLRVSLDAADTAGPSLSLISVADPSSGQVVRAPAAFWVYVPLFNLDLTYDARRSQFWVAVPGVEKLSAPGIAILDPETGVVERFLPMTADPQRLALSQDSRFLYVAAPGRIYRLDTESLAFDLDFLIPSTDTGVHPPETNAMAVAPGHPEVLVVSLRAPGTSPGYRGSIVFDAGVPRKRQLPPGTGLISFSGWTSAGQLIATGSGRVYIIEIVPDGLAVARESDAPAGVRSCVYENNLLYCGSGVVIDPAKGSFAGQFPAKGNVALLPMKDRIAFMDNGLPAYPSGMILCSLTVLTLSGGELVFGGVVPFLAGNQYGPLLSWGAGGLAWRDAGFNEFNTVADRVYLFRVP